MKKILVFAMVCLPFIALAQKTFTLDGKITGLKNGYKIYLSYRNDAGDLLDSSVVADGKFAFKGILGFPTKADMSLNKIFNPRMRGFKGDRLSFYLEPSAIRIAGNDSLKNAIVSGSAANDDEMKLQSLLKSRNEQINAINDNFIKLSNEEREAQRPALSKRFFEIQDEMKAIQLSFAKANPKSFVSLVLLKQLAADDKFLAEAEKGYNALSPDLKASPLGVETTKSLAKAKLTTVGATAMDFTQNDVNDKPIKLSDFKGKYVLLDFWASWCGPCRAENPNVVKAFQTYKDKNFTVLGVSLDQPGKKDAWLAAIEKDGLTWTHVSDLQFWGNAVAKLYGIGAIPANFLIDPNGKIIAKNIRGEELHSKLAMILGNKTK